MPVTDDTGTCACSKRRVIRMPTSSAVRSRSAARRQLWASRSPSNTPIVTLVLPTSMAKSIFVGEASPLGLPCTRSRATLRRRAPFAWLARGARSPTRFGPSCDLHSLGPSALHPAYLTRDDAREAVCGARQQRAVLSQTGRHPRLHAVGTVPLDALAERRRRKLQPAREERRRTRVLDLRENAVQSDEHLREHGACIDGTSKLALDRARAIRQLRRERRGTDVDSHSDDDVLHAAQA